MALQDPFSLTPDSLAAITARVSAARLRKYYQAANGDGQLAMRLYRWNCSISQSLWLPLQTLEIATRNSIASVLTARYGANWPHDPRFLANLGKEDKDSLADTLSRQRRAYGRAWPPVDAMVSDLSLGFWVSMLTRKYDVPFGWATRIKMAFPNLPAGCNRQTVYRPLEDIRILRNRIAHHEPIFHLMLDIRYGETVRLLEWISPALAWYAQTTSDFLEVHETKPV